MTSHSLRLNPAENRPVLREGTPVELIAVGGFTSEKAVSGNSVSFVLTADLSVDGKVLAKTGDVASGAISQVSNASNGANRLRIEGVNLVAGQVNIPLRSSQARGVAGPTLYKELPDGDKFEVTLFVAKDVRFPNTP